MGLPLMLVYDGQHIHGNDSAHRGCHAVVSRLSRNCPDSARARFDSLGHSYRFSSTAHAGWPSLALFQTSVLPKIG